MSGSLEHPETLLPWYVNGTLEAEEKRRVQDHLRSCLACRQEVAQLRDIRQLMQEDEISSPEAGTDGSDRSRARLQRLLDAVAEEAGEPRRPTWSSPRFSVAARSILPGAGALRWDRPIWGAPWLQLVTALSLVAVMGYWVVNISGPAGTIHDRGTVETPEKRLDSAVSEGAVLPRDAFLLEWHSAETGPGTRFSIRIHTAQDLALVYEVFDLSQSEHTVPVSELREWPNGTRLLWQVDVQHPDGTTESSPTFSVQLDEP